VQVHALSRTVYALKKLCTPSAWGIHALLTKIECAWKPKRIYGFDDRLRFEPAQGG